MITINNLRIVKILALLLATASSLYTNNGLTTRNAKKRSLAVLFEKQQLYDYEGGDSVQSRRGFLSTTVGVTTALLLIYQQAPALAEEGGPICIIGANGKTGSECVRACLARGIQVVATSRGGEYTQGGQYDADISKKLLQTKPCDVTIPSTVDSAILKSRAVIFAASASKAGGTASAVDNVGLVNVAKACINQKIPHLVIVSSGAVTKPDSPVYKFLNLFGNIMAEKIKGEDAVRELYKNQASGCTYTVIRPGGLTIEEGRGVGALELNQGDTKSGRISRADVASICVESTNYPQLTGGATFECYDADTAKPLKTVGVSNILKQKTKADDDQVFINGKERRGSTFREIFTGLEKDFS